MSAVGEVQVEVGCCLGTPSSLLAQGLAGGTSQVEIHSSAMSEAVPCAKGSLGNGVLSGEGFQCLL